MRNYLKTTIEDTNTTSGIIFDIFIQLMIIVSITSLALETIPDKSAALDKIIIIINYMSVVIFTIEYIARIYIANKPLKHILSFYGIIDLIAIIPFYIIFIVDVNFLRAIRLLRIIRILKILRYGETLDIFILAIKICIKQIFLFIILTIIIVIISGFVIFALENNAQPNVFKSVFDGFWWAVITLTTIGYGDYYPITAFGKLFTTIISILGLGIIAIPTGILASSFLEAKDKITKNKIK